MTASTTPENGDRGRLLWLVLQSLQPEGMAALTPEERADLAAFAERLVDEDQDERGRGK